VGEDWHEFFEDFPDMDPANSHMTPEQLQKLNAPGWKWVQEAEERDAQRRQRDDSAEDES